MPSPSPSPDMPRDPKRVPQRVPRRSELPRQRDNPRLLASGVGDRFGRVQARVLRALRARAASMTTVDLLAWTHGRVRNRRDALEQVRRASPRVAARVGRVGLSPRGWSILWALKPEYEIELAVPINPSESGVQNSNKTGVNHGRE